MITDCHTHYGIAWVDQDGDNPENWLAIPAKYNVTRFFIFGHHNLHYEPHTRADNDRLARLAARYPGVFEPVASAWPQSGKQAVVELQRCIEDLGFRLLKFHPWMQGFYLTHPIMLEIYDLAASLNVPIILHDGTPTYTLPEQVAGVARMFPKTTFVLGHGGLLWAWRSALEAMKHPNIWTTLCGATMRVFEIFSQKTDTDRLLWGSDYGFGLADPVSYRLNELLRSKIPAPIQEKILTRNPVSLLEKRG